MPKQAMFTLKLEAELHDSFMTEAAAMDRPASQIVREFMREFVRKQREAREHDAWFRAEVAEGLLQADDPAVPRIPHAEVARKWQQQRAELLRRSDRDEA
jgi:predicted transcriptional regulator